MANRIEPCSVTGGVLLFIFFSCGVAGIKKGVYLWGRKQRSRDVTTTTMKVQVSHSKFGKGEVVNFDGRLVTVNFNGEEKQLLAKMANLTTVDGKAFVPKVSAHVWVNPSNANDIRVYFGGDAYAKASVQDFKGFVELNGIDGADVTTNYRDILMTLNVNCLIVMNKGKHINTYTYNSK